MSVLRLMTQNQWNCTPNLPAWQEKGLDCSAEVRMRGHVRVWEELLPDIVGGQEVNIDMQMYLKFYCMERGLPYTIVWGNMTPLIYRADKLELLDTEYVLYPRLVEGLAGEFNDCASKSVNLGVFRCKESGRVFLFATTHLWWKTEEMQSGSDAVRRDQLAAADRLLEKYRARYGNIPVFLVGDLNDTLASPALNFALGEGGYTHAYELAASVGYTGDGMNTCGPNGPGTWQNRGRDRAIDHILIKGLDAEAVRTIDRYAEDSYRYLSDHTPLYIDAEL